MKHTAREMAEINRTEYGVTVTTIATIDEFLKDLGYKLNRSMDCRSTAKIMTGNYAGDTYPCCSGYIVEIDTGKSACNCDSRRDQNHRTLQILRKTMVAISGTELFEL